MPRTYDGILFDIDHTLCYDHQVEATVLAEMAVGLLDHLPAQESAALLDRFRSTADESLAKARDGEIPIEVAARRCFETIANQRSASSGALIDASDLAGRFLDRTVEHCARTLEVVEGIGTLLDDLAAAGLTVALVSNGWTRLQQCKAARIGFRGPLFVSDAIGSWKPDLRIFAHALAGLGLGSDRTVYAGDSPANDVAGAHAAGMATIWVNWKNVQYPAGMPAPDHVVRSMAELRALLL